jgi:hypothetical protein
VVAVTAAAPIARAKPAVEFRIVAVGTPPADADPVTRLQYLLAGMAVRGSALFSSEQIRRETIIEALGLRARSADSMSHSWVVRDLARDLDWLAQDDDEEDA